MNCVINLDVHNMKVDLVFGTWLAFFGIMGNLLKLILHGITKDNKIDRNLHNKVVYYLTP